MTKRNSLKEASCFVYTFNFIIMDDQFNLNNIKNVENYLVAFKEKILT